jgi:ABC-type amino acid transport substrate-binding protein
MSATPSEPVKRRGVALAVMAVLATAPLLLAQGQTAGSPALDRIRAAGRMRLGYRADARPFSYQDPANPQPAGYSVELCKQIVAAVRGQPGLGGIAVEWVAVTPGDRFDEVQLGRIDVLCGAPTASLSRRRLVSFSLPIFAGGIGAMRRVDAPLPLRELLAGRLQTSDPAWRAAAGDALKTRAFAVVQGTSAEPWLAARIRDFDVTTRIEVVPGYEAGIQALVDHKVDAFFGERAVLLDVAKRHQYSSGMVAVARMFTYEPLALAVGRNDDDLRLLVDGVLSRLYSSGGIREIYTQSFGAPDEQMLTFLRWNTQPE